MCLNMFINIGIVCFVFINVCVAQNTLDLAEGSACSRDGVDGVCVSLYRCLNAAEDIKDKNDPPICTFKGRDPIICCTDCELVNDTRNMVVSPTSGRWYFKTGEKARDKCLDYMRDLDPCHGHYKGTIAKDKHPSKNCHISRPTAVGAAGGSDAQRDEFPHMALLGFGPDEDSAQWLCGGSLISDQFVMTAAHCISSPSLGPVKFIALGILKRTDPPELWQRYNVKRIIPHPEYKPPSKYNDIALLETSTRVTFNLHVMPACLHVDHNKNDDQGEATGWGALGYRRELADTLQAVYVNEFTEEECADLYPTHRLLRRGYDHQIQMCYGHRNEVKDTCEGDSGGPLQNKWHFNSCQFTIIGVTSAGRQCGFVGSTGMYTRVRPYVPWIESVVWP